MGRVSTLCRVYWQHVKQSQRNRALPAHAVVYYVVALSLYRSVNAQEVLRLVCEGLEYLDSPAPLAEVGKSGISQARTRLGEAVLRELAQEVLVPMAGASSSAFAPSSPSHPSHPSESVAWASKRGIESTHYRGYHVVALDGSTVEVTDEAINRETFGAPGTHQGRTGYPSLRFTALFERGSGALFGVAQGGYKDSEHSLAQKTIESALNSTMLCLADRGFAGVPKWEEARATGAQLLWRVPHNRRLPVLKPLPDGSYLSTIQIAPFTAKKHPSVNTEPIDVRVIEYALPGHPASEPKYRLITTLMDAKRYPAHELAALYAERWGIETVFGDLKTTLNGSDIVLRSKTPDLVRQEFWGMMVAYQTVRMLMWEVAMAKQIPPDKLGFKHALNTLRRKLPQSATVSP